MAGKQRKMVTTLSFYSDQSLRLWDGTSHVQCGPPPLVNTLWKLPHRHTQRCATPVSQVVPTPGRGMREINTHTAQPFIQLPSARSVTGVACAPKLPWFSKQVTFCSITDSVLFLGSYLTSEKRRHRKKQGTFSKTDRLGSGRWLSG